MAFIRPERSFERFSRGAELCSAIDTERDGGHHPHAEHIIDEFDLTVFEWHYWRKMVEGAERPPLLDGAFTSSIWRDLVEEDGG